MPAARIAHFFNTGTGKKAPPYPDYQHYHKLNGCDQHLYRATHLAVTLILLNSLHVSMVRRIYGLADSRRSMPPAVRVGKHRMSGAVAQALWLRSQKFFHSFFPWALGMIPSNFQIEISGKKLGKNFPPRGSDPQNFWKSGCIPPRVMCLQSCTQIYLKRRPTEVGEAPGRYKNKPN